MDQMKMRYCFNCGADTDEDARSAGRCAYCGMALREVLVLATGSGAPDPGSPDAACRRILPGSPYEAAPLFRPVDDGVEITGMSRIPDVLEIPATIAGRPVVSIGGGAFRGRHMTAVRLGCNVRAVGDGAFEGCEQLLEVDAGESLKTIGCGAFRDCIRLARVTLHSRPGAFRSTFAGCYSLGTRTEKQVELLREPEDGAEGWGGMSI